MKTLNEMMKGRAMNSQAGRRLMSQDYIVVQITQEYIDIHPLLEKYMEQGHDRTGRKYIAKDGEWICWAAEDAILRELPKNKYPEFYI